MYNIYILMDNAKFSNSSLQLAQQREEKLKQIRAAIAQKHAQQQREEKLKQIRAALARKQGRPDKSRQEQQLLKRFQQKLDAQLPRRPQMSAYTTPKKQRSRKREALATAEKMVVDGAAYKIRGVIVQFVGIIQNQPPEQIAQQLELSRFEDGRSAGRIIMKIFIHGGYPTLCGKKRYWMPFYISSGDNSGAKLASYCNPFSGAIATQGMGGLQDRGRTTQQVGTSEPQEKLCSSRDIARIGDYVEFIAPPGLAPGRLPEAFSYQNSPQLQYVWWDGGDRYSPEYQEALDAIIRDNPPRYGKIIRKNVNATATIKEDKKENLFDLISRDYRRIGESGKVDPLWGIDCCDYNLQENFRDLNQYPGVGTHREFGYSGICETIGNIYKAIGNILIKNKDQVRTTEEAANISPELKLVFKLLYHQDATKPVFKDMIFTAWLCKCSYWQLGGIAFADHENQFGMTLDSTRFFKLIGGDFLSKAVSTRFLRWLGIKSESRPPLKDVLPKSLIEAAFKNLGGGINLAQTMRNWNIIIKQNEKLEKLFKEDKSGARTERRLCNSRWAKIDRKLRGNGNEGPRLKNLFPLGKKFKNYIVSWQEGGGTKEIELPLIDFGEMNKKLGSDNNFGINLYDVVSKSPATEPYREFLKEWEKIIPFHQARGHTHFLLETFKWRLGMPTISDILFHILDFSIVVQKNIYDRVFNEKYQPIFDELKTILTEDIAGKREEDDAPPPYSSHPITMRKFRNFLGIKAPFELIENLPPRIPYENVDVANDAVDTPPLPPMSQKWSKDEFGLPLPPAAAIDHHKYKTRKRGGRNPKRYKIRRTRKQKKRAKKKRTRRKVRRRLKSTRKKIYT